MQITSDSIVKFQRVIRNIAGCVMRRVSCDIDSLAHDVGDYEAILMERAWKALCRWRSDPQRVAQGVKAEHRYVCTALWREARGQEKRRMRPKFNINQVPFYDERSDWIDADFEWRLMARNALVVAGNELDDEGREAFGQAVYQGVVGARNRFCGDDRELLCKFNMARSQLAVSVPSTLMLNER